MAEFNLTLEKEFVGKGRHIIFIIFFLPYPVKEKTAFNFFHLPVPILLSSVKIQIPL